MICCKIITDLKSKDGDFANLINNLGKKGDFIICVNTIFFADTEGTVKEKDIEKILKKSGYLKYYIDIYTKDNQPQETDEINAWLANKLITINYNLYEQESQKAFHNILEGLKILNEEIDAQKEKERAENLQK